MQNIIISFILAIFISACSNEKETKKSVGSGMKCGAGKCGANMFDGNLALAKKKKNILKQMKENDTRKDCVLKAKSTKAVYNCVRDTKTKKMTLKCGATDIASKNKSVMKCGAGKCGTSMK